MTQKAPKTVRSPRSRNVPPPRLARGITVFALVCFSTVAVLNVLAEGQLQPVYLAGYLACVGAAFAVQYEATGPDASSWPPSRRAISLTVLTLLTYLPLIGFGMSWGVMGGPLAGAVLLLCGR